MPAPTLQASGTVAAVTTGNLTVTLPTHQADDILIVVVSAWVPNTTTGTNQIAAPAGGWAKLLSDPLINTQIDGEWAIFWLRATAGGTTNPAFTRPASWDTGTDTNWSGVAYVIRGCVTTGNPWDDAQKSALHSTANQAMPAVTVSGTERTVIQFLTKADDNGVVTAASGWTLDTGATTATGTDASFQTIRKVNVSASTTADTATITAPVTGLRYQFYGISFRPPLAPLEVTASGSATTSGAAALLVERPVTASGSATTDGTAALSAERPLSASGSVTTSGSAAIEIPVSGTDHPVTASGSAVTSGAADIRVSRSVTASGSATTSGAADIRATRPITASGSATTSGAADIRVSRPVTASGSATTSGAADIRTTRPLTASGTVTTSGNAAIEIPVVGGTDHPITASGSATTSGAADIRVSRPITAAGSATTSGAASLGCGRSVAAAGTVTTFGAATLALRLSISGAGAVATSGSANLTMGAPLDGPAIGALFLGLDVAPVPLLGASLLKSQLHATATVGFATGPAHLLE